MKWISLEKKYPQPDTGVIVTDGVRVWSAQWFRIGETNYWTCHGYGGYEMEAEFGNPTHWMPLPEPPSNLTQDAPDLGESSASDSESKPAPKRAI